MAEEIEKVTTSTPTENDGKKTEPVDTTETAKQKVEEGEFDNLTDKDFEDDDKSKADKENEPEQNKQQDGDKTFTQADVDKIIEKRIARLNAQHKKDMEELEARYKTGDYSPEIKSLQEELSTSKQQLAKAQNDLVRYEIDNAFMKENVIDEYKEFVEYKVLRMVTEEKDFASCLKEFKAQGENAKFFNKATGGKSIVPPRPNNSSANTEVIAGEKALQKAMGI